MNDEKFQLEEKIENNETVQKGKRGILRLLFSRTALLILLLLLQIAFIVSGYVYLAGKWYFVDGIVTLLSFILVVFIMNGRDNPAFKLVWIIVILALPIFGTPLYLFVEFQLGVDEQPSPENAPVQSEILEPGSGGAGESRKRRSKDGTAGQLCKPIRRFSGLSEHRGDLLCQRGREI